MHGIIRQRNLKEGTEPSYTNVRRIKVRYSDGTTMTFVSEAGREFFGQDDTEQMVKLLDKSSEIAEWAQVSEQYAE